MKILLMKGRGTLSRLIRWQTRSKYSHAAILIDGHEIIESWMGEGVRTHHVKDWSNIDTFSVIGMTELQKQKVVAFAKTQVGCKYDYRGALRFISRRPASVNSKWFCSELVFAALEYGGVKLLHNVAAWEVSPALLSMSPLLVEEW